MKNFIKCAAIRAIKTVCQTAIATIGTAVVMTDVNWVMVLSASALAGLLSILTSITTGLPEVDVLDFEEEGLEILDEIMEDENYIGEDFYNEEVDEDEQ